MEESQWAGDTPNHCVSHRIPPPPPGCYSRDMEGSEEGRVVSTSQIGAEGWK